MKALLLIVAVGLAVARPAAAQESVGDTFRKATEALAADRNDEALAGFHHLVALGFESPNLLYDLAVAYRRTDQPGRAILALERLLVLDPRDADARGFLDAIRTELGKARRRGEGTAGIFPRRGFLHAAAAKLRERDLAVATVLLSVLTFGVLWVRRFSRREALRLGLGIAAPVAAALLVAAGILLWAKTEVQPGAAEAVIVSTTGAALHEGPTNGSPETIRLLEGDVVHVVSHAGEWSEVVDEAGRRGWVAPGNVGEIFGPYVVER
ncbi:MAG: tetratricopeptide repeat protein [Deltaproteobacteria bacterium]|nr:tetratricopeptide repeat protein [Deltaproteobacteria bacterium]